MSRNSKQVRKKNIAKQITAMHKAGNRGPAKTKKLTKKVRTWFALKRAGRPIPQSSYPEDDTL